MRLRSLGVGEGEVALGDLAGDEAALPRGVKLNNENDPPFVNFLNNLKRTSKPGRRVGF